MPKKIEFLNCPVKYNQLTSLNRTQNVISYFPHALNATINIMFYIMNLYLYFQILSLISFP